MARALVFVAVLLATLLPGPQASAQTTNPTASITLAKSIIRRDGRDAGVKAQTINYNDCAADDALRIAVTVSGTANLEVWTGLSSSNCADRTYRTTNPTLCWQIGEVTPATTTTLSLKVRDLLPPVEGSTEDSLCRELAKDASKGSGTLNVNFLLTEGTSVLNSPTSLAVDYDLVAPAPPAGLTLSVGETRLFPTWTAPDAKLDVSAYALYCEPTESVDSCSGTVLVPDERPPTDTASVKSSKTDKTATGGVVSGLTNYTAYACAVAAVDSRSNVGVLSKLVCAMPQPVDGYFKTYRAAGGTAGGGCSFGHAASRPQLFSMLALAGLFVRRQRRRAKQRIAPRPAIIH